MPGLRGLLEQRAAGSSSSHRAWGVPDDNRFASLGLESMGLGKRKGDANVSENRQENEHFEVANFLFT